MRTLACVGAGRREKTRKMSVLLEVYLTYHVRIIIIRRHIEVSVIVLLVFVVAVCLCACVTSIEL